MSMKSKIILVITISLLVIFTPIIIIINKNVIKQSNIRKNEEIHKILNNTVSRFDTIINANANASVGLAETMSLLYNLYKNSDTEIIKKNILDNVRTSYNSRILNYSLDISVSFETNVFTSIENYLRLSSLGEYDGEYGNYTTNDFYKAAVPIEWDRTKRRAKNFYVSTPYMYKNTSTGEFTPVLSTSSPIYNTEGNIIGVAGSDVSLNLINESLDQLFGNIPFLYFVVDQENKKIILSSERDSILKNVDDYAEISRIVNLEFNNNLYIENDMPFSSKSYNVYATKDNNTLNTCFIILTPSTYINSINLNTLIIGIVLIAIVLIIIILNLLISLILKPIKEISDTLETIVDSNNLSTRFKNYKNKDEMFEIVKWNRIFLDVTENFINNIIPTIEISKKQNNELTSRMEETSNTLKLMVEKMHAFAENIKKQQEYINQVEKENLYIADNINANLYTLTKLSEESDSLQEKIDTQISATREMVSAVGDITRFINDSDGVIKNATEFSNILKSLSETNKKQMSEMTSSTTDMLKSVVSISDFVSSITDIAQQTNLLAMNAAIEAAHAGEHGRGFAVVAEEIRKLSNLSNKQAENATMSLKEVNKNIQKTIDDIKNRNAYFDALSDNTTQLNNILSDLQINSSNGVSSINIMKSSNNLVLETADEVKKQYSQFTSLLENIKIDIENLKEFPQNSNVTMSKLKSMSEEVITGMYDMDSSVLDINSITDNVVGLAFDTNESMNKLEELSAKYTITDTSNREELIKQEEKDFKVSGYLLFMQNNFVKTKFPERYQEFYEKISAEAKALLSTPKKTLYFMHIPMAILYDMYRLIADMFFDKDIENCIWDVSRHTTVMFKLPILNFIKLFPNKFFLYFICKLYDKMYTLGRVEIVKIRKRHAIMHITGMASTNALIEINLMAAADTFSKMRRPKTGKVELTHAMSKGDLYTEYIFRW